MAFGRYGYLSGVWKRASTLKARSFLAFIGFLESKTKARLVYENYPQPDLSTEMSILFTTAAGLKKEGVIQSWYESYHDPDEPPMISWAVSVHTSDKEGLYCVAGGSAQANSEKALSAALAEATERYVWRYGLDHFKAACVLSGADERLVRVAQDLAPEKANSVFLCVEGYSWTRSTSCYVPRQLVSGVRVSGNKEPWLRQPVTSGLATWKNQAGAVYRGLLELLERDAYMIMWLNQLTLPKLDLEELCALKGDLEKLILACKRYRIKPHFIKLCTDAPVHIICVVLEDETGHQPVFVLGLKAHAVLVVAAEGALREALQMRNSAKRQLQKESVEKKLTPTKKVDDSLTDRLLYWTKEERDKKLAFLITGPVIVYQPSEWEGDSEEAHLERILTWCREKQYECVSVSLTSSSANVTPWHIEMVVMPQLQWMHLDEKFIQVNETRRIEVLKQFGYTPRAEAFLSEPHPFA